MSADARFVADADAAATADLVTPDASTTKADAALSATDVPADAFGVEPDTRTPTPTPDLAPEVLPDVAPDVASGKPDAATPDASAPDVAPTGKPDAATSDTAPEAAIAACTQAPFVHLSPAELKALLDSGEDPILVNVKGTSIENIPGTDVVLANDVPGIESFVKRDLCANIVLYCRTGATSQSVGSQLVAKGYTHVRDLAGGITAWKAAGYATQ